MRGKEKPGAKAKKRDARPPRLRPDTRRTDPSALVGTSPSDAVAVPEPFPPFEGVTFSIMALDESNRPKVGRPRKPIDAAIVTAMAALGCTQRELAGIFGVSVDTLARRMKQDRAFCGAVEQGLAAHKLSIRRWQTIHLEAGNWNAAAWLGSNVLHQSRNPEPVAADPDVVEGNSPLLEKLLNMEASVLKGRVAEDGDDEDDESGGAR